MSRLPIAWMLIAASFADMASAFKRIPIAGDRWIPPDSKRTKPKKNRRKMRKRNEIRRKNNGKQ